jgi:hypothetical protein
MSGLMPREHGAYAQLGFPLLTGLIYGGGEPGAVAFAVVAVALFLGHEPMAVLAGVRGGRLQEQLRIPARRRILFLGGAAAAGLVAAAGLAPPRAWLGAMIPGGLGLLLLPALGTRRMKSIPAEIVASGVFAGSVIPMALCGDTTLVAAGRATLVWLGAILPAIFTVHAIKAALKKRPEERWVRFAAPAVAGLVVGASITFSILAPDTRELLAAVPPALAALVLSLRPPHPRHLKRVGWAMVTAYTATLVLLLVL